MLMGVGFLWYVIFHEAMVKMMRMKALRRTETKNATRLYLGLRFSTALQVHLMR